MIIPVAALEELETAEVAVMSHLSVISGAGADVPDEDLPDPLPMLLAVLRAVSTARGLILAQKMIEEMTVPVTLEHYAAGFCSHCGHEMGS